MVWPQLRPKEIPQIFHKIWMMSIPSIKILFVFICTVYVSILGRFMLMLVPPWAYTRLFKCVLLCQGHLKLYNLYRWQWSVCMPVCVCGQWFNVSLCSQLADQLHKPLISCPLDHYNHDEQSWSRERERESCWWSSI